MAAKVFDNLKSKKVEIGAGKMTQDTQMLDGAAKDSPVFNEQNETVQFTTPAIKSGKLGGENDPKG